MHTRSTIENIFKLCFQNADYQFIFSDAHFGLRGQVSAIVPQPAEEGFNTETGNATMVQLVDLVVKVLVERFKAVTWR